MPKPWSNTTVSGKAAAGRAAAIVKKMKM